jgi:hypothetical protein
MMQSLLEKVFGCVQGHLSYLFGSISIEKITGLYFLRGPQGNPRGPNVG